MEPEKKSNGAFIGLVIIIILLVIGGIYIWMSNQKTAPVQNSQTQSATITSEDSAALDTLQKDSNSTNTDTGVNPNTVN